jgi:ribosomal protein L21E
MMRGSTALKPMAATSANKEIEKYYIKYNFPSTAKLYKIMKADDKDVTHKMIKDYINAKVETQLLKMSKPTKKRQGHITAITNGDAAQMDIYDLSKYKSSNRGYKYILALVDIFTRKAYMKPMKNKNSDDVIAALEEIFYDDKYIPTSLTTDTDKAFMSQKTQRLFDEYNIIHNPVIARDDHRALGIIDRMALTLKIILSKIYIIKKNTTWIDDLDDVVDRYNNTPHSSIDELTPDEATHPDNQYVLSVLNRNKSRNKPTKPLFNEGDTVRIRINKTFRKGTEPRYSDAVYIVESVQGQRITLNNGKTLLESELLKVDGNTASLTTNPIDVVNKENRTARRLKQAGVNESDIVEGRRERKPNQRYL